MKRAAQWIDRPYCPGCETYAAEHIEYKYDDDPDESARQDGTYNPSNGHFLCMKCYIKAGMPSSPNGWVCP